jgi:hypothetical protein
MDFQIVAHDTNFRRILWRHRLAGGARQFVEPVELATRAFEESQAFGEGY